MKTVHQFGTGRKATKVGGWPQSLPCVVIFPGFCLNVPENKAIPYAKLD